MAGWDLKQGLVTEYNPSEDRIWSLFNFVFSDSCRKRNTYKFGLIKSLLDNLFNGKRNETGVYYSYEELFGRFAENYWNLIVKYDLRQMRPDGKSYFSKIETILKTTIENDIVLSVLEFDAIDQNQRLKIIKMVTTECKKCVVGALYGDFEGIIYSFDLKEEGLTLSYAVYEFMLKYKLELEKLNYYAWAKFLEKVNDDSVLIRLIDKLELSTPRRKNLSVYREILSREFEQDTCFYCGKKLTRVVHVDHFVPWSYLKNDRLWNFVLSCSTCNIKKNNKIPNRIYLNKIEDRNTQMLQIDNDIIQSHFLGYSEGLLSRIWNYARLSGVKENIL